MFYITALRPHKHRANSKTPGLTSPPPIHINQLEASSEHRPTGAIVFISSSCLIDVSADALTDVLNTSLDQLIGTVNQIQCRVCIQKLGLRFIYRLLCPPSFRYGTENAFGKDLRCLIISVRQTTSLISQIHPPENVARCVISPVCLVPIQTGLRAGSLILEHLDTKDQTSQLAGCICRRPTGSKMFHSVGSVKQSFNKMRLDETINAPVVILRHFTTSSSGLLFFFLFFFYGHTKGSYSEK